MARLPSHKEIEEAIATTWQPYVTALGKVAHSWNFLQESLAQLFAEIMGSGSLALAVWYSSNDDRTQRRMLRAATERLPEDRWATFPNAKADILWLLGEADIIGIKRNDAIHGPCSVAMGDKGIEIVPAYFWGNPRARSLMGKDILKEFRWYELCADTLSTYVRDITTAISWEQPRAWPDRPLMPTLGQRSIHRESRRSTKTKRPQSPPRSSPA